MKQTRLLFIDRDGTLIQEPEDEQIDSFEKLVFTKGVFRNLTFIAQHTDYELVMVSNQDGLGTDSFPEGHLLASTQLHHPDPGERGHPLRQAAHRPPLPGG